MSDPQGSVTRFVEVLATETASGREQAAREIWNRYVSRLIPMARHELDQRTVQRVDEDDVVQSVFASFYDRVQEGKFAIADRDDLWRLLVTMTIFKSRRAIAKHRRQRRDARREETAPGDSDDTDLSWSDLVGDDQPTPAEALILVEDVERRLNQLDQTCRQVALWRLEGYSNQEIAAMMDVAERTVERKLERIRKVWLAAEFASQPVEPNA